MSDTTHAYHNEAQHDSASCATTHEKQAHAPHIHASAMAITQIIVVILLASAAASPIATAKILLTFCMLILLTFLTFWPLHGNMIDRAIALCAGIASAWCATLALKGWLPQSVITDNETVSMSKFIAAIRPYERWAVSFALILVATTFVTFIRQMLREHRTNLVRNLSHTLIASIACAALPGWLFLPSIIRFMPSLRSTDGGILVVVLCIFMVIILSSLSYLWMRNNCGEYYENIKNSTTHSIAFAILPIMLSGMLIYIAGLGVLIAA